MGINGRTALVFGATGLVGKCVVNELRKSREYNLIRVFNRAHREYPEDFVQEIITDLTDVSLLRDQIQGDELYICLGTTIKKAGSIAEMERIDRDIPLEIARLAAENGVKKIAVVSSIGAKAGSRNYYLRIKGEMEEGIMKIPFESIAILRPSMLIGQRGEFRFGEAVGKVMMNLVGFLMIGPLKKYKAIKACHVAKGMQRILMDLKGTEVYESDEIYRMSSK